MEIHHKLMIIGVAILLIGGVLAGIAVFTFLLDPSEEAEWDGSFGQDGGSMTTELDGGTYDVWVSDASGTVEVTVEDDLGHVEFEETTWDHSETININGKDYYLLGSFRVDGGNYTVETDGSVDVYITPPIDIWLAIGSICGAITVVLVGIIMILIGAVQWFVKHMRHEPEPVRYRDSPRHPPDPYRQEPDTYRGPYREEYTPPTGEYLAQDEYRRRRRQPPPPGYDR